MTLFLIGGGPSQAVATAVDEFVSAARSRGNRIAIALLGSAEEAAGFGADVILIQEIPFKLDAVCAKIADNELHGKHYSIVVVAEGARAEDGEVISKGQGEVGRPEVVLGGIGE